MPLQLVTGRANSGKTGVAYDLVRSSVANGSRVLLILPTIPDVSRARAELAHTAPLGLTIATFEGAVGSLWAERGDGRLIATRRHRDLVFAGLARSHGASRSLARLASECVEVITEQSGIVWRAGPGRVPPQGADLARLINGYGEHLEEVSLVEANEAAHLLAVEGGTGADLVVVHRFSDFTRAQLALIDAWAEQVAVLVTLTWLEGFPPTRVLNSMMDTWSPHIHHNTSCEDIHAGEIDSAVEQLFRTDRTMARSGVVRFCLADGEHAEARGVVEEVADALAGGLASSAERVAVVCRDLPSHTEALRVAFEEADIAAQIDVARPFAATPLGAAVLDALDFALTGSRPALLSLVRSPFSGVAPPRAREMEAAWRRRGLTDATALLGEFATTQPRLGRALTAVRRAAHASALSGREAADVFDLAAVLYRHGQGPEDGLHAQSDASAERAIVDVLDEIRVGGLEVTLSDVVEALRSIPLSAETTELAGHVQIMPVTRVRGRRFDVVVIGGLNLGEFPAPPSELMLPGGAVDATLHSFCGCSRQVKGADYDHLLFYEAVTRARNRVVLSAQRFDDDGEMRALSPLYEMVADRFRTDDDEREDEEFADRYTASLELPTDEASRGRTSARGRAVARRGENDRITAAIRRARHLPGAPAEQAWVEGPVSPSQIEAYLACPYRWFYQRVLRPRELEHTFDARGEGEFSHLLLADTYRVLIESAEVPLGPGRLQAALRTLDDCLNERLSSMQPPSSLAEQIGRRRSAAWARRILCEDAEHTDGFTPAFVEWSFGLDDEPVELEGFKLAGRLDRLDVDAEGRALVIDYKRSCGAERGAKRMLADGKVQLPLYLAAVEARLGHEPVGGLYRGLSATAERGAVLSGALETTRGTKTDRLEAEDFARLMDDAMRLAREAVEGMRAGMIQTRPRTKDGCVGCPVGATCGGRQ